MGAVREKVKAKKISRAPTRTLKVRIIIEPYEDEKGTYFVAICPMLPGCVTQGNTRKEALENIKDAIKGYLMSLKKHGEPIPLPISEETVEIRL